MQKVKDTIWNAIEISGSLVLLLLIILAGAGLIAVIANVIRLWLR